MDSLTLVGLSHRTAPIDVRERVAFSEKQLPEALGRLVTDVGCQEGLILSTCNRVEVIVQARDGQPMAARLPRFLHEFHSQRLESLDEYLYTHEESDAVRHIFRVASSLDSMVVGEPQVLFQLKDAFRKAVEAGSVGRSLNHLIPRAFFVAKRIRTETRIANAAVSVSSIAVELAEKIFGDFRHKSILMIGAGKMGELAGRSLIESGVSRVFVANRTPEKAFHLASRYRGEPVPFEDLDGFLCLSDIVLVSTGARNYVLERPGLASVMKQRRNRPLFIIDISVPRNVDPLINEMENVFLYDIDDLQAMAESHLGERIREAEAAEEIISEEVQKFLARLSVSELGPVIADLRAKVENLCLEDLRKNHIGMAPDQYERVEQILLRAAHKMAHPLIVKLKEPGEDPSAHLQRIEWIKQAFCLGEKDE